MLDKRKSVRLSILFLITLVLLNLMVVPCIGGTDPGGGYDVTSELWLKTILLVPETPIPLVWKAVGTDITPSGAQVVSGYFYANPNDFSFGSPFNPEVFVKIYIDPNGWANLAFNHVTVDPVGVYSSHKFNGVPEQTGTISLTSRLLEHQYSDVHIPNETDPLDVDDDGDGQTENQGDCNDSDAGIYSGGTDICGDGIDQDCDGSDLACDEVPPWLPVTEIEPNDFLPAYQPLQLGPETPIIRVPNDYSSIGSAIASSENGDAIMVSPGTYQENIDFSGKNITLFSEKGPDDTIIDGGQFDTVVVFHNTETSNAILHGFTITNGLPKENLILPGGGGISIINASPTISSCHIKKNGAELGGGIAISGINASPAIQNNLISKNIANQSGGGIESRDGSSPLIKKNVFTKNISMIGSAMMITNMSNPTIEENVINGNLSGYCMSLEFARQYLDGIDGTENQLAGDRIGATMFIADHCSPVVRSNDIIGNAGTGIAVLLNSSPTIENNDIIGNFNGMRFTGGVLVGHQSHPIFSGNRIERNQAGAMWVDTTSSLMNNDKQQLSLSGYDLIEDLDQRIAYTGHWDLGDNTIYSGGTRHAAVDPGASATISFTGTGVSLISFAFPNSGGIAEIKIDGVAYPSIDTYCPEDSIGGKSEYFITGNLPLASHTLTITIADKANPLTKNPGIVLDAVGVMSDTQPGGNTIGGSIVQWSPVSTVGQGKPAAGSTWNVPAQFSSIQAAINSANDGDTIVVSAGLYKENIDFLGKQIALVSTIVA